MISAASLRRLTRILSMVPWVIDHPYPLVSEVMERFGYQTEEQLVNDLNLLWVCGVPGYGPGDLIEARIADDRVVLDMAEYFSRPIKLTPREALGLLSAGMAVAGTAYGTPALATAVDKLTNSLFPEVSEPIGVELPDEPEYLESLRRAARDRRVVEITYLSTGTNRTTVREVEPRQIHASMGKWYLSAYCRLAEDRRLFRVDRIRSIEERQEHFDPPPEPGGPDLGFTPSADAVYAILALGPKARWVAEYYPVETISDSKKELLIRFAMSGPRIAARLLIRLGDQARLVEGEEVAEETSRLRQSILARYGET